MAMTQELYDRIQQLRGLALYRKQVDGGKSRIVTAPFLGAPIASAFERLFRFDEPTVEVGRLGIHEVHFVCCGIDAVEDGLAWLGEFPRITREGAVNVRHMAGGRC